ncbi:acetate--CoA ligase family protein [Solemya velum gill symbiont]|nr:acetate--CoA ligase family protein [Solemya velum gill symbiont]
MQSCITGEMNLCLNEDIDLSRLDTIMSHALGEIESVSGVCSVDEALMSRILYWTAGIQRHFSIPLYPGYRMLGKTTGTDKDTESGRTFRFVLPSIHPQATLAAFQWVITTLEHTLLKDSDDQLPTDKAAVDSLLKRKRSLGKYLKQYATREKTTFAIYQAAWEMDVPVRPLSSGYVVLGYAACSRMMKITISDQTTALGVDIARNKLATSEILHRIGLPVPGSRYVKDSRQAVEMAERIGYPVVIKPSDHDQGRGVYADLHDAASVEKAYEGARKFSKNILIEKHISGFGHRLTVYNGKIYSVTRKTPAGITGDGVSAIDALIANSSCLPFVTHSDENQSARVLNDESLGLIRQYGLTTKSVLPEGHFFALKRRNNAADGGVSSPVPVSEVHPDNRDIAIKVARVTGLDFAGVDLISPDIRVSWRENGAVICEVNAQPEIHQIILSRIFVDMLPLRGRIDAFLAVTAAHQEYEKSHLGYWIDSRSIDSVYSAGRISHQPSQGLPNAVEGNISVLQDDPDTHSVLVVMSPEELAQQGLPFDLFRTVHLADCEHEKQCGEFIEMLNCHADEIVLGKEMRPI